MSDPPTLPRARREARLRLAVIAPLLASPPRRGELAPIRPRSEPCNNAVQQRPVQLPLLSRVTP
ncbi:MAG: hypothetical protein GY898_16295 [Proteobacteria bacterium]|nr:hypothetical protein [Pseudomonadota bacterium]